MSSALRHARLSLWSPACILALLAVMALAVGPTPAAAQAVYGSIAGTVNDSTGAAMPGATVTITSVERKTTDNVTTNASGNYSKERLLPGFYEVKAELSGFKSAVVPSVRVNVDAQTKVDFRLDEAITKYREAARLQPDYLNARHNLGGALVQKGAFAEALPYLREAVRARPDDAIDRNNLGGALLATGRVDEAIRELRRAAEIDARSLNAHYNLGRALAARGLRREAVEQMEAALRIAPSDPDARQALAELKAGRIQN